MWLHLVFLASSEVGSCITDNGGWESYMDDEDGGTIADQVTRFVGRFVDRVGTEAGISQEHLKSLYTMIPGESVRSTSFTSSLFTKARSGMMRIYLVLTHGIWTLLCFLCRP